MSISTSDLEERVLTLEREIWRLPDLNERRIRLTAFEQQIMKLGMFADNRPTTQPATFTGTVIGCNASAQSGRTVAIKDHASGSTLATATTDALGSFSGPITLSGGTQSVDITLDALAPYAAFSVNRTFAAGVNNAVGNLTLAPDAGHVCFPGCGNPISKALSVTDTTYGTFAMLWDGINAWRTSGATVDYTYSGGGQSCVPANGVPVQYILAINTPGPGQWQASVNWHVVGGGNTCPGPNTPVASLSYANSGVTCSPFQITRTFTSGVTLYLGHETTITITE